MIERSYTVRHQDTTMYRKMRSSALFSLMTDMSVEDMESKGAGVSELLKRDTIWVAVHVHAEIDRTPDFGESLTAKSWAVRPRSVLFPRYFTLTDRKGTDIVRATALWALADINTRHFAFPEEKGVSIQKEEAGPELRLPPPIERLPLTRSVEMSAPYSYIDINGHLSNMHYLDIVENVLPEASKGMELKRVNVEYAEEIRPDTAFTLAWGAEGKLRYVTGTGERRHFSMNLEY